MRVVVIDAPHRLAPEGNQMIIDAGAPAGALRRRGKRILVPLLARRIPRECPIAVIAFATFTSGVNVLAPSKFGEDAETALPRKSVAVIRSRSVDAKQLVRQIGPFRPRLRLGIINPGLVCESLRCVAPKLPVDRRPRPLAWMLLVT